MGKSKFVTEDDVNNIIDKVSKLGTEWVTQTDKNRIELFNEGDEKILAVIGDIITVVKNVKKGSDLVNKFIKENKNFDINKVLKQQDDLIYEANLTLDEINTDLLLYGFTIKDEIVISIIEKEVPEVRDFLTK
jgi:hypothetical protein